MLLFSGIISQSPLRLELQFEPVLDNQWYLVYTFLYAKRIDFTGSTAHQEPTVSYV